MFDLFVWPFVLKISFSLQKEEDNKKGKQEENMDQFWLEKRQLLDQFLVYG